MPMPDLNTLMQYVNASQQNAFIPAFMQSEQVSQDRAYKQQQMDQIIQEMKLKEMMAPFEQRVKGATADQLAAQAAESQQRTAVSQGTNTPEAMAAMASRPGMENLKLDEEITQAGLKRGQESIKYNEQLRKEKFINDFMLAETPEQRKAIAESDPEMWMKLQEMSSNLQRAKVSASPGTKPTDYQIILQSVKATNPNLSAQQAAEEAARIYSGRSAGGQPTIAQDFIVTPEGKQVPLFKKETTKGSPASSQPRRWNPQTKQWE